MNDSTEDESGAVLRGPRFGIKQLMIFVTLACFAVALFGRPLVQFWNNGPHDVWKRASPFTDVQVDGEKVVVEFNQQPYELVSINEVATEDILRAAKFHFGFSGEKRFVEDLPQVLINMGMPDEDVVDLVLKDDEGRMVYAEKAPMTAANRLKLYRSRGSQPFPFSPRVWIIVLAFVGWLVIPDLIRVFRTKMQRES